MTNDCLISKLSSVIQNDELVKFGFVRIKCKNDAPSGVCWDFGGVSTLEDISLVGMSYTDGRLTATGEAGTKRYADINASKIKNIITGWNSKSYSGYLENKLEDFEECSSITTLDLTSKVSTGSIYGDIGFLYNGIFPKLTVLDLSNCFNIGGDFSNFLKLSALRTLNIPATAINGNCDVLINNNTLQLPSLTRLQLHSDVVTYETPVTIKASTVVFLANNSVNVLVKHSQIDYDTMTQEQFDALYPTLPTPPTVF